MLAPRGDLDRATGRTLGEVHYREKYGVPDGTDAQFNTWVTTWVTTNYQTSRMFRSGLPFSVTVASREEDTATEVMRRLDVPGRL